jgi:hypothetical protein
LWQREDVHGTHKLYWLALPANVRFTPKSGHQAASSITSSASAIVERRDSRTLSSLTSPQGISTYWSGFHLDLKRFNLDLAEFDGACRVL